MIRTDQTNRQISAFLGVRLCGLLVIMGVVGGGAQVAEAQIDVTSWKLDTVAVEGNTFPFPTVSETTVTTPVFDLSRTLSDGLSPDVSTTETIYDFLVDGSMATFHFGFDHKRAGTEDSASRSSGEIRFTVLQDLQYDFTGMYSLEGSLRTFLSVELTDITLSPVRIFESSQDT